MFWVGFFCFPSLIRSYSLEVQRQFALIHSRFPATLESDGGGGNKWMEKGSCTDTHAGCQPLGEISAGRAPAPHLHGGNPSTLHRGGPGDPPGEDPLPPPRPSADRGGGACGPVRCICVLRREGESARDALPQTAFPPSVPTCSARRYPPPAATARSYF